MRRMNVVAALNSKYTKYTYVMLTSLLENQNRELDIHIYLMENDLTSADKVCLEKLVQAYEANLHWLHMESKDFDEFCKISKNWSKESFFRLALPDVLPEEIDKILYLDVDIIVNRSLEELYFTDFEGKVLCACAQPFFGAFFDMRDEIFEKQLKQDFSYFNSGVLLLNITLLREKYSLADYLETVKELNYRLLMPDQDLLNYMHWQEVKLLDISKYNLLARLAYNCDVHYEQAKSEAAIVHFTSDKPWNGKGKHFDIERLWWDYAKKTPYYGKFVKQFLEEAGGKKMKVGIQYQSCLWEGETPKHMLENGFPWIEIPYEKIEEYEARMQVMEDPSKVPVVAGIVLKGVELDEDMFFGAMLKAEELGATYLLINTEEMISADRLTEVVENCAELISEKEVEIYLENGLVSSKRGGYQNSIFSQAKELKKLVNMYNLICDKECFGISISGGNANLIGKNVRAMVEDAGESLKHLHINDNDGFHNEHQMPFTFTRKRGERASLWYRLIGAASRLKYDGWLIFDTTGAFNRVPKQLHQTMLEVLRAIADEWEDAFRFEEYISVPNQKIVLFGAGIMAGNFMSIWGRKYRPAFLVDNSPAVWNTERFGVEVKAPEAILDIPKEERNVWICNQYYAQIGAQLEEMGIAYRIYDDHYDI